ncbi:diacylglycerol kinase family lipid kinase [Tetragenococcus halophilus]|uniref:diacylglycerol/lipid kinase family protein n=1 Tax=Tetragenococcus halophilus TaxID=51669 RepID=UPI000B92912D|nr:diacylglycerol kinase family protein [Tetragenococcus halophilus]GMG60605.1 diacylglycerol kinase family lipid kinase [Tetragenococcus halophilus]GMG63603.1 diacylglycerol kinase family lipid kinase [Tetragenococcus halophilus]GMG67140.1 diacylglycerol kinase family lipid kinase [Tetragenococcus halophilus]
MKFHYYLLINPAAGGGKGQRVGKQIISLMEEKKLQFTVIQTKYPSHEAEIASELTASVLFSWNAKEDSVSFPLLIVIGGDGTLHQVINYLTSQIPIAYIPAGSGNDFARSLGFLQSPAKILEDILQTSKPRKLSVLSCYEKNSDIHSLCVNNIGVGLDAAIVHATNHSAAKQQLNIYKLNALSYVKTALGVLFRQKGFPISIECNHQTYYFEHAFLCTATNHPYFGGGVKIAPMANVYESGVELVVVERLPMLKIFYLIILLGLQRHVNSKYFHRFKANRIHLKTFSKQFLQKDGEDSSKASYDFILSSQQQLFWF